MPGEKTVVGLPGVIERWPGDGVDDMHRGPADRGGRDLK